MRWETWTVACSSYHSAHPSDPWKYAGDTRRFCTYIRLDVRKNFFSERVVLPQGAQVDGGFTIPGDDQEKIRCCSKWHGLEQSQTGLMVELDDLIGLSNINDSMILWSLLVLDQAALLQSNVAAEGPYEGILPTWALSNRLFQWTQILSDGPAAGKHAAANLWEHNHAVKRWT